MPARVFTLTFGEAFRSDDPIARWIMCLAMAWNDIVFTHELFTERSEGGRGIYLVRVAAAHLSEVFDDKGPFAAGYDDWPDVQMFLAGLPKRARDDFESLRATRDEQSMSRSFGWRLDRMRNYVFHYPHLHAGASAGARLELAQTLRVKSGEEGTITLDDGTVRGTRLGLADEISLVLAFKRAEINPESEPELREFTLALVEAQQCFIRFGETTIDGYLRRLPNEALRAS